MKRLLPLFALFVGLSAGWYLSGRVSTSESSDSGSASDRPEVTSESSEKGASGEAATPSEELTAAEVASMDGLGITEEWIAELEEMDQLDQLSALLERMKLAKRSDFATLMDAVQKFPSNIGRQARGILVTKWATVDPNGMIAYIDGQPESSQWSLRHELYTAWANEDIDAAYASALSMSGERWNNGAIQSIIQVASEKDPQRAIDMVYEMKAGGYQNDWLLRTVFQKWAHRDSEAARAAALALPEGSYKVKALTGALSTLMREDSIAALDWLDSLPMDGTVYNSRKAVFREMLNSDFETAKAYIASRTSAVERREVLNNVYFGNMARNSSFEELQDMHSWLGTVATGQVYDRKVGDLMRALVQVDKERATALVLQLPAGNARMNAIGNFAQQMAQEDPGAAIEFATSLAYDDEKQRALSNMGWQLARYGIEAVKPIIAGSEDPMVQRQLASRLVSEWALFDQPGALDWAESLSDVQARNSAVQSVYQKWMQADPQEALSYLENSVEAGKQSSYLRSGFQDWAREDPKAAVEWLDQMPESLTENNEKDIYRSVTQSFVQHDPMAASEWIATLDDGPNRDRSVETLVQNISKSDPEAGFYWAVTVGDDKMRSSTLNQTVGNWAREDPDAAYEAVKDSDMEAEEKKPLFEMIESKR
ncbi:MAG: hypothetical protein ACSHYA_17325 [Opitutaceae bacterium]